MTRIKTTLTRAQRAEVYRMAEVYRNTGPYETGRWFFEPKGFDSTFTMFSDPYPTRREAVEAAYQSIHSPTCVDLWFDIPEDDVFAAMSV